MGYGDWVGTWRGYTGYPASCSGRSSDQRSGPRKALQGPGVGGSEGRANEGTAAGSVTTPAGPGRGLAGPSLSPLEMPPPGQ